LLTRKPELGKGYFALPLVMLHSSH